MVHEESQEELDAELRMKYDLFLAWLEVHAKENNTEMPSLYSEDTDNFQDTEEIEEEIDDIFLEPEEPPQEEVEKVRTEESKNKDEETNIFLNFSLNRRPSVLEILGIPEDDPIHKKTSETACEKSGDLETFVKTKPLYHNKGKAPEPPQHSLLLQPPPLPKRTPVNPSMSPVLSSNPEKNKKKKGLKGYLPTLFAKSEGLESPSNSTDDFGKETQI